MTSPEHESQGERAGGEPLRPLQLPPELATFLAEQSVGCLLHATDRGTALVVKAPAAEIDSVRGRVPIRLRHELYAHPTAPVIRTVLSVYDRPDAPLALETFTNVDDPLQRADFAALAGQDTLYLLFYDDALAHRLTKAVPLRDQAAVTAVVAYAARLLAAIPPDRFDFDGAKQAVLEATRP